MAQKPAVDPQPMADPLMMLAELKALLEYIKKSPDGWMGAARDIADEILDLFTIRGVEELPTPGSSGSEIYDELCAYWAQQPRP